MIDIVKQSSEIQKKMELILKRCASIIGMAVIASTLSTLYWVLIASDRYVSEAHIIIQSTNLGGGEAMDFASLLGGGGGNQVDQLLLRDHLLSIDMLKKLDAKLNLRKHYSNEEHDLFSRMGIQDAAIENFHLYYLSRVIIEYDEYAGLLIIKSQGYDADTAYAITSLLVSEGENFMNQMAHSLAENQVLFLETQVADINQRFMQASHAVLAYQDEKGLVSPKSTTENIAGIIASLRIRLTELETELSADQAYLVPGHSKIVQIKQQMKAVQKQIKQEQSKLASTEGRTLNSDVMEFQRLEMEAEFIQDIYKTALVALEGGRIEATRTIKKVTILQSPTQPEYSLEPRRLYNTTVYILIILLLAGVANLLVAIVRDHKD